MTPDHRQNPKLMWGIAAGLVVLIVAVFAVSQFLNTSSFQHEEPIAPPVAPAAPSATTQENAASEVDLTAANILIDSSILDEPVHENEMLAKEELAKLDDIYVQLAEQESTLEQQHLDADDLIKLKEEQIKLLEAQLAAQ